MNFINHPVHVNEIQNPRQQNQGGKEVNTKKENYYLPGKQ